MNDETVYTKIGKLHSRFPSSRHFTTAIKTEDGRYWVPLDEVEPQFPDPEKTAWVLDETKQTLLECADQEIRGIFVMWNRQENAIRAVATVQDAKEIIEALEATVRQYRNPSFARGRRLIDLGS